MMQGGGLSTAHSLQARCCTPPAAPALPHPTRMMTHACLMPHSKRRECRGVTAYRRAPRSATCTASWRGAAAAQPRFLAPPCSRIPSTPYTTCAAYFLSRLYCVPAPAAAVLVGLCGHRFQTTLCQSTAIAPSLPLPPTPTAHTRPDHDRSNTCA